MKRKLIAVIIALLLADVTVASAKSPHKRPPPRPPTRFIESPEAKFPPTDPYAVWVAGTYVGRDPDPKVRSSLIREFYHNFDVQ